MSDAVTISIIGTVVGPAIILVIGWLLNRKVNHMRSDTAATKEQVQNSHKTNLRDDIDGMARDIRTVLRGQGRHENLIDTLTKDVGGLRDEMGHIRQVEREQWKAIEDTRPVPQARKPRNK